MKAVPSYTKVLAIGSSMTENSLVGDVVIQEKIDGSQFAFGFNEDGQIKMRSKGAVQSFDVHDKMFKEAVEYINMIATERDSYIYGKIAPRDVYYYCEYLQKPKHNTLKYDRIPNNHLVLFDVLLEGRWATREELENSAKNLNIDVVPELYRGPADVEKIKSFLTTKSYLGGPILEGVVIKNYNQTIMLGGHIFPLFTKYVREEFKELHSVDWKIRQPKATLQDYVKSFATEARWQKSVIHMKEDGELTNSPKDIGPLIKRVQQDIEEEEKENIKNNLYKMFRDDILRTAIRGIPEWYKNKLLESLEEDMFDDEMPMEPVF